MVSLFAGNDEAPRKTELIVSAPSRAAELGKTGAKSKGRLSRSGSSERLTLSPELFSLNRAFGLMM